MKMSCDERRAISILPSTASDPLSTNDSLVQAYKTIILGLACSSDGQQPLDAGAAGVGSSHLKHQIRVMVSGLVNAGGPDADSNKDSAASLPPPQHHLLGGSGRVESATLRSSIVSCHHAPSDFIRRWQQQWQRRVCKSLNNMSAELEVPLSTVRSPIERKSVYRKWDELSSVYAGTLDLIRPVFSAKDFYDTITHMKNPNRKAPQTLEVTDSELPASFYVPPMKQVKDAFMDLLVRVNFISEEQWLLLGEHLLQCAAGAGCGGEGGRVRVLREYVRAGCPHELRRHLWQSILGVDAGDGREVGGEEEHLKQLVVTYDMLVDKLIVKDVKLTAVNDPQYFVFEEKMYQVLLTFMRDTSVLCAVDTQSVSLLRASIPVFTRLTAAAATSDPPAVVYPPCGIVPFHGFSMLLAPLCFVFADNSTLYRCFRALYIRHFHQLHYMSSRPTGILHLCCVFECLLKSREAGLYFHLRECNCQPVRVAFRWLLRAFAGYLSSEQILYLWDVMVAQDSTLVLPVLAAAIFCAHRRHLLATVSSQISLDAALSDISTVNVVDTIRKFFDG